MKSYISIKPALLAVALTTVVLFSSSAAAGNKNRSNYQNAGGNCHATNWYGEWDMERNALGYRNTATANNNANANVLVSCNFATDVFAVGNPNSAYTIKVVQLFARNTLTNRDVNMSCSITAGYATGIGNFTNTKSMPLLKTGAQKSLTWSSADNGGKYMPGPASVVCSVPAGVELNDAIIVFDVDVGN